MRLGAPRRSHAGVALLHWNGKAEHVVAVIADQSDLALEETAAELRRHRFRTSRSALSRFFTVSTLDPRARSA
jgi:hypothetical protein